ncbi:MAG: cytochrome c [Pseudomonadota bacterium]
MTLRISTISITLGLALAAGAAVGDGHSQGPHASAIKNRQAVMSLYGFNMGILGAMAKGQADYDSAIASAAANNMVLLVDLDLSAMWPQGSEAGVHDGSRAKAELWANFPDVVAKMGELQAASAALSEAAGTDLDTMKAAMGPVGQACSACHKAYRAPKN